MAGWPLSLRGIGICISDQWPNPCIEFNISPLNQSFEIRFISKASALYIVWLQMIKRSKAGRCSLRRSRRQVPRNNLLEQLGFARHCSVCSHLTEQLGFALTLNQTHPCRLPTCPGILISFKHHKNICIEPTWYWACYHVFFHGLPTG